MEDWPRLLAPMCTWQKKFSDQSNLDENLQDTSDIVTEKFNVLPTVKKLFKRTLNNEDIKKEYDRVKKRWQQGVNLIDIQQWQKGKR